MRRIKRYTIFRLFISLHDSSALCDLQRSPFCGKTGPDHALAFYHHCSRFTECNYFDRSLVFTRLRYYSNNAADKSYLACITDSAGSFAGIVLYFYRKVYRPGESIVYVNKIRKIHKVCCKYSKTAIRFMLLPKYLI